MSPLHSLDARVAALETSLRRTRLLALLLGVLIAAGVGTAFVPQALEAVRAPRLVLTTPAGDDAIVLVAGPGPSLILQGSDGAEVMRLGGPASRRIGH